MTTFAHKYPPAWKRDILTGHPGLAVVESGLIGFLGETSQALGFPLESIDSVMDTVGPGTKCLLVDLPYEELVHGPGKGYLMQVQAKLSDWGYPVVRSLRINQERWGSPVHGFRLFVLGADKSYKLEEQPPAVLADTLPEVAFHSVTAERRSMLYAGYHTAMNYANSKGAALSGVLDWGEDYPVCEKRVGNSLSVCRLSTADIRTLWGYIPDTRSPLELLGVTPLPVLKCFLHALHLAEQA